jgi:hypothetical protein
LNATNEWALRHYEDKISKKAIKILGKEMLQEFFSFIRLFIYVFEITTT